MAFDRYPILSQPIRLHWAGWETDTFRLQQAGWQLSAQEEPQYGEMRIAMKHERLGHRALTHLAEFDHAHAAYRDFTGDYRRNFVLPVSYMAHEMKYRVVVNDHPLMNFRAIDARPQKMMTYRGEEVPDGSFDELCHFAVPLARTQEIIVPEESVDDLLSRILEKQQASKQQFFEDKVRREMAANNASPAQRFHAQIISLSDRRAA